MLTTCWTEGAMPFLTSGLKSLAVAAPLAAFALPAPALVAFGEGGEVAGAPAMAGQAFPGEPKPAGPTDTTATENPGADTKYHAREGPVGPLLVASRATPEAGCIRRGVSAPTGGTLNCAVNAIDQSPGWTAMAERSRHGPTFAVDISEGAAAQAIEGEKRHPGTETAKLASWCPRGRDEDGAALPNMAMPGIRAVPIGPVNLDGPTVEYLVTSRLGFPEYIALDAGAGKMYPDYHSSQA